MPSCNLRIGFKSVLSHLECQCRWCRCEKGNVIEIDHDFLRVDGANIDYSHKVAAIHNSVLVFFKGLRIEARCLETLEVGQLIELVVGLNRTSSLCIFRNHKSSWCGISASECIIDFVVELLHIRVMDWCLAFNLFEQGVQGFFQFNSHHPSPHKCSVATTLLDRAKSILPTDADKISKAHVVNTLKINGYTDQFIRSCQRTTSPTNQSQTHRGFVNLPYIQGTSGRITRSLNQFNINVAHKLKMTFGSILKKT